MLKSIWIFLSISVLFNTTQAQLLPNLSPLSNKQDKLENISTIELPAKNWTEEKKRLIEFNNQALKPFKFGYAFKDQQYDLTHGKWTTTSEGDQIWTLAFYSPGARSLNVLWSDFYLPKGATLFVYNEDKSDVIGAYSHLQNNKNGVVSSWPIAGDKIIIEYNAPNSVTQKPSLTISKVVHGILNNPGIRKDLNESGDCNYDVDCSIGPEIDPIKEHLSRSIGLMLINGESFCTSCLVNNTAQDRTPYLLTANHCMISRDESSIVVRFGWKSDQPDCGTTAPSGDGPKMMIMTGMEWVASNGVSDMNLLLLNNEIPAEWDRVFAGWDHSGIAPPYAFSIHHPRGDIMKVSREDDSPLSTTNDGVQSWEIQSQTGGWELGTTEPGSSGAPLFDPQGSIIGQLAGGSAACSGTDDNDREDFFGRIDLSWDASSFPDTRLKDWLDPMNTGQVVMPSLPAVDVPDRDISLRITAQPAGQTTACNSVDSALIHITLSNRGRSSLDSIAVIWALEGVTMDTLFQWLPIDSGQTDVIYENVVSISNTASLDAYLYYLNETEDDIPANDSSSYLYEAPPSSSSIIPEGKVYIKLRTDNFPQETSWRLTNSMGDVVASGSNYTEEATIYQDSIELSETGCYTLNVLDSEGDGLCCDWGFGYFLFTDSQGDTLSLVDEFQSEVKFSFRVVPLVYDAALHHSTSIATGQNCHDADEELVELYIKNEQDSVLSNIAIVYQVEEKESDTIMLESLGASQDSLILEIIVAESERFYAEIIEIENDQIVTNNVLEYYSVIPDPGPLVRSGSVIIEIELTGQPEAISWNLSDQGGPVKNVLFGTYRETDTSYLYTVALSPHNCYTFTINDSVCSESIASFSYNIRTSMGLSLSSGQNEECSQQASFYTSFPTITQNSISSHITIYPNPFRDIINILSSTGHPIESVEIYTIHGHFISRHKKTNQIQLSNLQQGSYIIKVIDDDGTQFFKVLKQ
jgi:hypothetical protein